MVSHLAQEGASHVYISCRTEESALRSASDRLDKWCEFHLSRWCQVVWLLILNACLLWMIDFGVLSMCASWIVVQYELVTSLLYQSIYACWHSQSSL